MDEEERRRAAVLQGEDDESEDELEAGDGEGDEAEASAGEAVLAQPDAAELAAMSPAPSTAASAAMRVQSCNTGSNALNSGQPPPSTLGMGLTDLAHASTIAMAARLQRLQSSQQVCVARACACTGPA